MSSSLVDYIPQILDFIFFALTIGLPIVFWNLFFEAWVDMKRQIFWNKQTPVLLEIVLPKEVLKTPSSMEVFLLNINQTGGEGTWYDRNFLGKTRPQFSLEMVSIEGTVHFYIWTWKQWKKFIETQIYAQYPGIEVTEVKDYTKNWNFDPESNGLWGCEFELGRPDPFPIKTYRDYGIGDDKLTEEDVKVDPITPIVELLGSVDQKQQMWIQIICRGKKEDDPIPFSDRWKKFKDKLVSDNFNSAWKELWKGHEAWKTEAQKQIEEIKKKATPMIKGPDGKESPGFPNYVKSQIEQIEALGRSVSKPGFEVGIRCLYLAENEFFDGMNGPALLSVFKQFGSSNLNGFKPKNVTSIDYPWQDFFGTRIIKKRADLITAYKARGYFFEPYKEKPMILNTEELATIFHFPGKVVGTPTFERIGSKKSEPPANLPI